MGITHYIKEEEQIARRLDNYRVIASTIDEVKRDLDSKRSYEKMEASFQRDQASEIKGATIRPKSMIRPSSNRQSVRKSVSKNPNHYFQFFKQIIRKTEIDYDDRTLEFNNMPIIVNINAKLVKIHYLFQM